MKYLYVNNPVKVFFGKGCRVSLIDLVKHKNCLFVTSKNGKKRIVQDRVLKETLSVANSVIWLDDVRSNPNLNDLDQQSHKIKGENFETVVAIGGGSVIDTAKFIVAVKKSNNSELKVRDFLTDSTKYSNKSHVEFIAVPTTFGTGSEVTPFATVWDNENGKKYSLSNNTLFADYACVDSELSHSLPLDVTLSTGLDAICQAFESIWNRSMNSYSETLAHRSISDGMLAVSSLLEDINNAKSREIISNASLMAGLCISHTKTALCHSISYPLTSMYGIPHGIACAFTIVEVLKYNLSTKDKRFERLACSTTNSGKINSLIRDIENILIKCGVYIKVREKAQNLQNLLDLSDQMISRERSDNCLFMVNNDIIRKIVSNSWNNH
jgi:alcohol dehydrogenase